MDYKVDSLNEQNKQVNLVVNWEHMSHPKEAVFTQPLLTVALRNCGPCGATSSEVFMINQKSRFSYRIL